MDEEKEDFTVRASAYLLIFLLRSPSMTTKAKDKSPTDEATGCLNGCSIQGTKQNQQSNALGEHSSKQLVVTSHCLLHLGGASSFCERLCRSNRARVS